jgi:beta-glucosidase-like glycosyl hydrolase
VPTGVYAVLTNGPTCCALQLKPALAAGLLSPADIDNAVNRTLAVRFVTGQFDAPRSNPWRELPISTVNGRMSRLLARNVVQKGERHTHTHQGPLSTSNTVV